MGQKGFWDREERQEKLNQKKPLLDRLDEIIPWDKFRLVLEEVYRKERKNNAGRKPIDVIVMFKLLLLQQLFNISDDEVEFQVNDRLSFMNFLRLGLEDRIPDAKTIWLFRKRLIDNNLIGELFEEFDNYLRQAGYQAEKGQIIDATLIPIPKQRNSREENEKVKNGEVPEVWLENQYKLSQKDLDARWTQKNGETHYGYKNHISIDLKYGFIRRYTVTDAATHDSQVMGEIIDIENEDNQIWADSAYRSEDMEWALKMVGFESEIHERSYRNRPLSQEQKKKNREKSKIRAKVEHVFGAWVTDMGGKLVRSIGKIRVGAVIGLRNLAYNIKRYVYWKTQNI